MAIKSFKCRDTEALFAGRRVAKLVNIEAVALRKLATLNRVVDVTEMRIPPSNKLEALKRDRAGQWNIRVNEQWRLCFRFEGGDAFEVEIVDYH